MAKQVGEVRGFYPIDRAVTVMEEIFKTPLAPWIEKEERHKDFNPPVMEKYEGKGDPMAHLFHLKHRMSMEKFFEALNCKLIVMTLTGKALSWLC